jgi:hypothetical protein
MRTLTKHLQTHPHPFITNNEIEALLTTSSDDSRYSKVKRLLAEGKLLHLRRGLYVITDETGQITKPHPFELAQYIYGPSYVSLESALSYHNLIPEAVYTTTSATTKRAKDFQTPLGMFSYLHLPLENFYTEVALIHEDNYHYFMAKPWKAICDYIYCYKKNWKSIKELVENLRLNEENLISLRPEEASLLNEYYHSARIHRFLKGVQNEC